MVVSVTKKLSVEVVFESCSSPAPKRPSSVQFISWDTEWLNKAQLNFVTSSPNCLGLYMRPIKIQFLHIDFH
jgi:hypothetical protein